MEFEPITETLIQYIQKGNELKNRLECEASVGRLIFGLEAQKSRTDLQISVNEWFRLIKSTLKINGLYLSALKIENIQDGTIMLALPLTENFTLKLNHIKSTIQELINICEIIEKRKEQKSLEIITIDDIDNFQKILSGIDELSIDKKFYNSAFLEDDVEETFLEILNEPYKEYDSGAEMRDLYTNNIKINGKRIHTAIMFKGRGVKKTLTIADCGKNGNQLLKLAKNTTAQLYIVQHVNKIDPDVTETLKHHLLAYSQLNKIIICIIDGKDTARILKAANKDLQQLMDKKSGS